MACDCEIYECLGTLSADCESIILNLEADETGVWQWRFGFNERWFQQGINVTNGEPIEIPNILNEQYITTMEFINVEGEKFNDKCYTLDTSKLALSSGGVAPDLPSDVVEYLAYIVVTGTPATGLVDIGNGVLGKEIAAGGTSFIDVRLIGLLVTTAETASQSYTPDNFTKVKPSNTFAWTNGMELTEGQIIILYTTT